MNRRDEGAPTAEKESGKRKIGEVEPNRPIGGNLKFPAVTVDRFGAINVLFTDEFGALQCPEGTRPKAYVQSPEESSTGSFTPLEYNIQGGKGTDQAETGMSDATPSATYSSWTEDIYFESGGTSSCPSGSQGFRDSATSHSSTPHGRASTSFGEGPPLKRACTPPYHHNVDERPVEPEVLWQNELIDLNIAEPNESEQGANDTSLATPQPRYSIDRSTRVAPMPTPTVRFNIEGSILPSGSPRLSQNEPVVGKIWSAPMVAESSDMNARHSREPAPVRFNYRFASAALEALLLQRMEERQSVQNEPKEADRCGHVVSPEDLIWGSVKNYCGMVLDRETRTLLGTAVLFVPPDPVYQGAPTSKSAWVTCVKIVEGRTEVLIKNSKGAIHVAQLMLTSTALGLALFNVHIWQGTFALAFLSRVTGPASLPHRPFVDVDRSDRVYVIGYEEPWESESGTIADCRVRPGRIIDAGRHTVVEIDFTTGQLGGSINSPAGFRGGLVVRADGLLAGVVTGEILGNHRTSIDFASAFNVYSLLAEMA